MGDQGLPWEDEELTHGLLVQMVVRGIRGEREDVQAFLRHWAGRGTEQPQAPDGWVAAFLRWRRKTQAEEGNCPRA